MQKILVLIVSYSLAQLQMAYAAEGNCQPLPNGERDVFVELLSEADANALLQVNVDDGEVCVIKRGSIALNEATAANFSVSAALDELVVEGLELFFPRTGRPVQQFYLTRSTLLHCFDHLCPWSFTF